MKCLEIHVHCFDYFILITHLNSWIYGVSVYNGYWNCCIFFYYSNLNHSNSVRVGQNRSLFSLVHRVNHFKLETSAELQSKLILNIHFEHSCFLVNLRYCELLEALCLIRLSVKLTFQLQIISSNIFTWSVVSKLLLSCDWDIDIFSMF